MLERAPLVRSEGSVTGIDLAAALRLAELAGYDVETLAHLLPVASAGIFSGARQMESGG